MAKEKIRDFQIDICDPQQPTEREKVCPDCIPNPDAIVSDWRLSDGQPFLNEKTCEYQIAVSINQDGNYYRAQEIRAAYDNDIDLDMILQSFVLPGLRVMLRFYEKEETDNIVCAFPPDFATESTMSFFDSATQVANAAGAGFLWGGPLGSLIVGGIELGQEIAEANDPNFVSVQVETREDNITNQSKRCRSIYKQMVSGQLPKDFHNQVTKKIEVTTGLPDGSTFNMVVPDPVGLLMYQDQGNPVKNPEALELYARAIDYDFGSSPGEPMQVLIAIPTYVMDRVPQYSAPSPTEFDGAEEVVLEGPRIKAMLSRLSEALRVYGQFQAYWWQTENATLYQKVMLPDGTFVSQTTGVTGTAFTESSSVGNIFGALGGLGLGGSADDLKRKKTVSPEIQSDYELEGDPSIFYVIKYQQAVLNFYNALHDLLELNDFRLTAFPNFLGDRAEEVKIVFEPVSMNNDQTTSPDNSNASAPSGHFTIKSVWAKYDMCGWKKVTKGMGTFRNHPTVRDQTVMGYISRLPEIDEQLMGRETPPWLDFIVGYTYPPLDVRYHSEIRSDKGTVAPLGCIIDGAGGPEAFRDWIFNSIMSVGDAVAYQFNKNACKLLNDPTFRPSELKWDEWNKGIKEKALDRVNRHYDEEQRMLRVKGQRISEKQYKNPDDKQRAIEENIKEQRLSSNERNAALQHPYRSAAMDAALEQFDLENSFIGLIIDESDLRTMGLGQSVWKNFKGIANGRKRQSKFELFKTRMDKCGLNALMIKAIECLMGGVTLEVAYEAIVKAALNSLSAANWEVLFVGIPFSAQIEIKDKISEILGEMPPPWEWSAGKNQIPDEEMRIVELSDENKSYEKQIEINLEKIKTLTAKVVDLETVILDLQNKLKNSTTPESDTALKNQIKAEQRQANEHNQRITDLQRQNTKLGKNQNNVKNDKAYSDLKNMSPEQMEEIRKHVDRYKNSVSHDPQGKYQQGTFGKNLAEIQKVIYDIYIDTIIEVWGVDSILKAIERFPGAKFIVDAIKTWDCPYPPLFNPPAASFMGSLSLDLCRGFGNGKLSLPKFLGLGNISFMNIIKVLARALLKAVTETAMNMLVTMIVKILQILESAICKAIELAGRLAVNALTPGDQGGFQGAIGDVFCGPGASDDESEETASALLAALGVTPQNFGGMDEQSLKDSHKQVMKTISSVSTRNELKNLMVMDPRDHDPNVIRRIARSVSLVNPEYAPIFADPNNVSDIFASASNFLTPTQIMAIREELDTPEDDVPLDDSICLTKEQLDQWNQDRIDLFTGQGLPEDVARDWVKKQNDKIKSDLVDVCSLAARGVDGPLEDELSKLTNFENAMGDPDCLLNTSALSFRTPETDAVEQFAASGVFRSLSKTFQRDLAGGGWIFNRFGVIDHILADSYGIPMRTHEKRVKNKIWRPSWANSDADFQATKEREVAKLETVGLGFIAEAWYGDEGKGYLPDTVGILLQEQLYNHTFDYTPNFSYEKTRSFTGLKERFIGLDYRFKYSKPAMKTPDLVFKYKDVLSVSDTDKFGYGFNLSYHSFVIDNIDTSPIVSDRFDYDVLVDILLSKDRTEAEKELSEIEIPDNTGPTKIETLRMRVENTIDKERKQLLQLYPTDFGDLSSMNYTYEGLIWWKHCSHQWKNFGIDLPKNMFAKDVWSNISNKMFADVANIMMFPNGDLPAGFKYGYSSDSSITFEDLLYVNPSASPNDPSTWEYTHEEEEKVLGKSATENPRVHFLDPDIHGGWYAWPKVYIERFEFDGLLSVLQLMIPDIDGCQPKKTDFLDWKSLADRQKEVKTKLIPDKRLSKEEECVKKIPFDLVQTSDIHGYIEASVMATVRTYISEFILKALPALSSLQFNNDNYDDAVAQLIVEYMASDMPNRGGWLDWTWIKRYDYWLHFLEQSYQIVKRRIDLKEMESNSEIDQVISDITDCQRRFVYVTSDYMDELENTVHLPSLPYLKERHPDEVKEFYPEGKNPFRGKRVLLLGKDNERPNDGDYQIMKGASIMYFGKTADQISEYSKTPPFRTKYYNNIEFDFKNIFFTKTKARRCAKLYSLHSMRHQCKRMLKYIVKEELEKYSVKISDGLKPKPNIASLSRFYIGAGNKIINGGLKTGKSEVENPMPAILESTGEEVITYLESPGTCLDVSYDVESNNCLDSDKAVIPEGGLDKGQFVLEKYIRLVDKNEDELEEVPDFVKNRPDHLRGVVNIPEFRKFVNENMIDNPNFDPDRYKLSDLFGDAEILRDLSERATGIFGSIGFKFGVRLCFIPPLGFNPGTPTSEMKKKAQREKAYFVKKASNGGSNTKYIFPIATFEKDVLDDEISKINWQDEHFGEDIRCYIDNLTASPEFKLIFDNIFPLRRASSLVTLYTYHGWMSSIGKHESERNIDYVDLDEDQGLDDVWREGLFEGTKNICYRMFHGFYETDSWDWNWDWNWDFNFGLWFKDRFPAIFTNIDPSVRWWQRWRIEQNRPFDKDNQECTNIIGNLFVW